MVLAALAVALIAFSASWNHGGSDNSEPQDQHPQPRTKLEPSKSAVQRLNSGEPETDELRAEMTRELEQRRRETASKPPVMGPIATPERQGRRSHEELERIRDEARQRAADRMQERHGAAPRQHSGGSGPNK
jgi:hypothetical protein